MDLGRGEREGEERADSGSGGRASSGSDGVAALVHARGEGEREELLVDLWRGGERGVRGEEKIGHVGGYKNFFSLCRVSWIWALGKVFIFYFFSSPSFPEKIFSFSAECPGSGHSAKFFFHFFLLFLS